MLHPSLHSLIPEIERILRSHKVKRAHVFGSSTTENFGKESDVDLLVAFEDGLDPVEYGTHYLDALYELEDVLGRDVDLVAEETLKPPLFHPLGRTFKGAALWMNVFKNT